MSDRAHAPEERDVAARSAASASATPALAAVPEAVLGLQRTIGNAAVGRVLARDGGTHVSPGPVLEPTERNRQLGQLDRAVQDVLRRYGRTRVARPSGAWRTYQAESEPIDFDWTALLFILHRTTTEQGAMDYLTVLRSLMIPALRPRGDSLRDRSHAGQPAQPEHARGGHVDPQPAAVDPQLAGAPTHVGAADRRAPRRSSPRRARGRARRTSPT